MVKSVSGLEDVSKYPDLVATFLRRGVQSCDVGENYWTEYPPSA